jgi:UDP-N-acetyl-D-glucosamine dehydrogenase
MLQQKGMQVGRDFFLAFSPEREDPGNQKFHPGNIPKVVGGVTPECLECAKTLYGSALSEIVPVSSTSVAGLTKRLENIYRRVNIALVMSQDARSEDGDRYLGSHRAAATSLLALPHFIPTGARRALHPIDPFYSPGKPASTILPRDSSSSQEKSTWGCLLCSGADRRGLEQPEEVSERFQNSRPGVAYKKDIDDDRESLHTPSWNSPPEARRAGFLQRSPHPQTQTRPQTPVSTGIPAAHGRSPE